MPAKATTPLLLPPTARTIFESVVGKPVPGVTQVSNFQCLAKRPDIGHPIPQWLAPENGPITPQTDESSSPE